MNETVADKIDSCPSIASCSPCFDTIFGIILIVAIISLWWKLHLSIRAALTKFAYALCVIYFVIYFPRLISLAHTLFVRIFGKDIELSEYLDYMATVIPTSIAVVISALALKISLYNESILLESSIGVIRAYLEIFCDRFFENSEVKYYSIKFETFESHLRRLVKNHILNSDDKVLLCEEVYKHTRNFVKLAGKSPQEGEQEEILLRENPNLQQNISSILDKLPE